MSPTANDQPVPHEAKRIGVICCDADGIRSVNAQNSPSLAMLVRLFAFVALLCPAAPAMADSWSGLYLGPYRHDGYLALQLVQTDQGGVVGRYRQVVVTETGKRVDFDVPVTGAVRGTEIVGRIERPWIQGGVVAFSGTRTNSGIRLSGGDGLQSSLIASTHRDEQAITSKLAARAHQAAVAARAAKAEQDADSRAQSGLANIDAALTRAREFQARGAETLKALSTVQATYEAVTARHEKMAAHARALADGVARSQVSVAMNQLAIARLDGTNIDVQSTQANAEAARYRVERGLVMAKDTCMQRESTGRYESEYLAKCQLVAPAVEAAGKVSREMEELFRRLDEAFEIAQARYRVLEAEIEAIR